MALQKEIQTLLRYTFKRVKLLHEALRVQRGPDGRHVNQRLALLGDAILRVVIVREKLASGLSPRKHCLISSVGFISKQDLDDCQNTLSSQACNHALRRVFEKWQLGGYITWGRPHYGPVSKENCASTVEALVGAVWLDSGESFVEAQKVVQVVLSAE